MSIDTLRSAEYQAICAKLPPRKPEDFEVGDWVYYSVDNRPPGPCGMECWVVDIK